MSARERALGRMGIWAGDLDTYPAAGVREAAAAIEDLGYSTLWFAETTGREAMAQAAILLSATRRITVAAGMTDIYARDAVTTAAAQRTLEEAFPGRFLLGLWESHPSLAEDVRGHHFSPPPATMRSYLDTLDAAPFGPPTTTVPLHRVLAALDPTMLALAAERTRGANVLGMPVEYTRTARATLGPDALLAITQLCVLSPDRSQTAGTRHAPPCLIPHIRAREQREQRSPQADRHRRRSTGPRRTSMLTTATTHARTNPTPARATHQPGCRMILPSHSVGAPTAHRAEPAAGWST